MVFLNFNTNSGAYTYGSGVNAANLTSQHIKDANAKLDPFRQQRIANGLLKITSSDPGYKSPVAKTATTRDPDYENWTKKELAKALVDRRIKSHSAALKMNKDCMIASLRKADKDPSFDRFTSLPAELRNQVYRLTLADDKRACALSAQPSAVSAMPQQRHYNNNNNNNNIKLGEIAKEYGRYFDHAAEMGWVQHMRRFHFRVERHSFDRKTSVSKHWHERHFVKFARNMSYAQTWVREKKEDDAVEERVRAAMAGIASRPRVHMGQRDLNSMLSYFVASANTAFYN